MTTGTAVESTLAPEPAGVSSATTDEQLIAGFTASRTPPGAHAGTDRGGMASMPPQPLPTPCVVRRQRPSGSARFRAGFGVVPAIMR